MVNHMGFINFINLVYDTYNYSIHGVYKLYKPIYNIWGPHNIPIFNYKIWQTMENHHF